MKSTIRRTPNARRRTRRMLLASALAPFLLCFASGCAVEQQQVSESLDRPGRIDCRTADGDLRVLQGEKAHVAQRLAEGATAIYPAGAVMGIVMGTEGTKLQVATGEYNDKIDARMAEIKSKCGIY